LKKDNERVDRGSGLAARAQYYGLVSETDAHLGRLFDMLKESGEWERTLIIFSADHGEQLGDHYMSGKTGFFEQSFHIPMIVRDPRSVADATRGSVVSSAFTENIDIMPTILEWTGGAVPSSCDGFSLLPFTTAAHGMASTGGREEPAAPGWWREEAVFEFDFRDILSGMGDGKVEDALGLTLHQCNLMGVRGKRYKLIHFNGPLPPLLYDLEADPAEAHNLARDPAHAGALLELTQKALTHRMTFVDRGLGESIGAPAPSGGGLVTTTRRAHLLDTTRVARGEPVRPRI
jgi:arylsulfatase A-like enzyme